MFEHFAECRDKGGGGHGVEGLEASCGVPVMAAMLTIARMRVCDYFCLQIKGFEEDIAHAI